MTGTPLWIFLAVPGLFLLLLNVLLTREVVHRVPFMKERLPLLLVLWLVPLLGAFYAFRKIGGDYYDPPEPGNTAVSVNVMGMGDFFNPNAKTEQVIEERLPPDHPRNIMEK